MSRKKTIPGEADIKTLITNITGFERDDVNFDLCLQFVQSHVKYHRFLSVDSHKIIKTLNGICTKFSVHCQNDKAEALKRLIEKFELSPLSKQTTQTKTDGHYAVLSLLLELSNCPTENVFKEKQVVQPEVEPEFDWAGYLLADEDYCRSHYLDSTDDSEDEEDTNDFNQGATHLETIATESNDYTGSIETQKNWLLRNLVIQYWNNDSKEDNFTGRFPCSNLHRNWDRCLVEGNPFHVSRHSFITEVQLIREILWMLSGVSKSYVFIFEERRFTVNPDVYLSHLTDYCMENSLQKFMKYGSQVMALETFCEDVVNYSCDSIDMSSVTQTYQAFVSSLSQFLKDFKKFLSGREIEVRNQETPMTMSILYNQLEPWFQKIELVYSIYISGIAAAAELDSSILKASHLLNVMFKTLIDCDTLGEPDRDKMSLLLVIWIQTCRPYFDILSDWITSGNLIDPREDFLIQRNKTAQSFDETFWENAFLLRLDNKMDISSSKISRDINIADATTIPRFLRPVLKEIALTGKSMELLFSMGQVEKVLDTDVLECKQKSLYEIFVENLAKMLGTKSGHEAPESVEREVTPEPNITKQRVEEQLQVKGVYDPLLRINFETIFDTQQMKNVLHQRKEDDHLKLLYSLEVDSLQPLEIILQHCLYPYIQHRYNHVCSHLINIIKHQYHLFEDMKAMRSFFLMEAGGTLYDFYSNLFERIKKHEEWRDDSILGFILEEALESKFSDISHRLTVEVEPPSPKDKYPISLTDCIKLHYQVAWPANMVISQKYQERYNEIFSFILQIKRAKYCLEHCNFKALERKDFFKSLSISHMAEVGIETDLPAAVKIHRMQILRFRLLYFVNSLHNYIMTRILHSTGIEFEENLEKAQDLDQIIAAHVNYLHKIYHHCLLDTSLVTLKSAITKVLNLILVFENYWQMGVDEISATALEDMEMEFSRCVQFLGSFLNSVIKRGSFPHLESLAFAMVTSMGKT